MRPYFQLIKLHLDFNFLELWVVFKRICGMLFETESEQNILISLMFMTLQEFSQNPKSGQNLARFWILAEFGKSQQSQLFLAFREQYCLWLFTLFIL